MADWSELAEGFEYDAWANIKWLKCLAEKDNADTEQAILGHILSAQKMWALRTMGESPSQMPVCSLTEDAIIDLCSEWQDLLFSMRHDPVIEYRRLNGDTMKMAVSQVIRHVINHGTYHRGEIRGLLLAKGDEQFPETDLMWFMLETQPRS